MGITLLIGEPPKEFKVSPGNSEWNDLLALAARREGLHPVAILYVLSALETAYEAQCESLAKLNKKECAGQGQK